MSEEEKQMFNKMIYCNLINGEQALKFNRKYEDLQQKVEQLEKENEKLKYLVDDSNIMKAFIVEHNKVEQLENIRKEAIEYIKKNYYEIVYKTKGTMENDLLNILNKGDNNE